MELCDLPDNQNNIILQNTYNILITVQILTIHYKAFVGF